MIAQTRESLAGIKKGARKIYRKIREGVIDLYRVRYFFRLILDKIPEIRDELSTSRTYLLESEWVFDHHEWDYATINLEGTDEPGWSYEDLIAGRCSGSQKESLLRKLRGIFEAQVFTPGSYQMVRLYRVLGQRHCGLNAGCAPDYPSRDVIDFHLFLKPLCDFDKEGNPIPCKFKK